ncbi:hypothetical protein [Paenibacillus oceani]|uniref:Uncharacterized protein n=1 Tax=Paenibacillus oceani TaxID=2772510 RepID=A0A927CFQ7_9BACL|nr:hypothetical protein [Paenibacillus oceani]MBD2865386.1 hypothetical protein [Paenibacillus oceani]
MHANWERRLDFDTTTNVGVYPNEAGGKRPLRRVSLEMSLKPFRRMEPAYIEQVCTEAFRQWLPLIRMGDMCTILLWVSDGSEILEWDGNLERELEWAKYIGFANEEMFGHTPGDGNPQTAIPYIDSPMTITYSDLREIVRTLKRVAAEQFGVKLEVGATFDPGPEFAYSEFKYKRHPEINRAWLGGREIALKDHYTVVCPWSKLNADPTPYAGFPQGIEEGTSFGTFLGRQCASFLPKLEFDYIWFSNGFGFSYFPWTYLGANFDGNKMPLADYRELSGLVMSFWDDFKRECPGFRTEVRGTNYGSGMEAAKDCIPLLELYDKQYLEFPPPNSPWAAMNYDFGLELAGYMSRIAYLPKEMFMFRFYVNDPWFWQNPWWDFYDREPHDIYCPLSVGRLNADGQIEGPSIVEILSIDTEKGSLWAEGPNEVIPHMQRAIREFPDQPGLLTWLYPFREYQEAVAEDVSRSGTIFFEEWLIRNAINEGLPLNTVVSTDNVALMNAQRLEELKKSTVLLVPGSLLKGKWSEWATRYIRGGGRILIYGKVEDEQLCAILNLRHTEVGLEGEMDLELRVEQPDSSQISEPALRLNHGLLMSAGAIDETVAQANDLGTTVRAEVRQGESSHVFALTRELPEWQGGRASWVRGSLPFVAGAKPGHLPVRQEGYFADSSVLLRYALDDFGWTLRQARVDAESRAVMLFITRSDNAYWFTGCAQDTSVAFRLGTPEGVPLFPGQTVYVEDGIADYRLGRTFHDECRIFVRQPKPGLVFCQEKSPYPTRVKRTVRTIAASRLKEADLTVYPPLEALRNGLVEITHNGVLIKPELHPNNDRLIVKNISGAIGISW